MKRLFPVIALSLLVIPGCDGSHSSSPSLTLPPTAHAQPTPPAPPPADQTLIGIVSDTAYRPIEGARVEMLDGPLAGTSIVSDAQGRFWPTETVVAPWTIRVAKEGFVTATVVSGSNGRRPTAFVRLEAIAEPVSLAGEYTLTVAAADSCAGIPAEFRTRTYAATIAPAADTVTRPGTSLTLTARGAAFQTTHDHFPIGVSGEVIAFLVYDGEDFGLVEEVAPATYVSIGGIAHASAVSTISAPLEGTLDYCELRPGASWRGSCAASNSGTFVSCGSARHRLTMTSR